MAHDVKIAIGADLHVARVERGFGGREQY
jgi:hypothetical protein